LEPNEHSNQKPSTGELSEQISELEAEISSLERRFVNFFVSSTTIFGRDPILAAVLAYFLLHQELTQKDLRDYTGYSAGAISQVLKQLVEGDILIERRPEGRGAFRYALEKIPDYLARSFLAILESYLSQESELNEIKKGLEKMPKELHSDPLYKNLKEYINLVFKVIPIYKKCNNLINQELEQLHNRE